MSNRRNKPKRPRGESDEWSLEVIVGSPHTAEEAKEALRRGLIPIERWTAGDGRDIEGGVRMDGKIIGYGRVTEGSAFCAARSSSEGRRLWL